MDWRWSLQSTRYNRYFSMIMCILKNIVVNEHENSSKLKLEEIALVITY